MIDPNLVYFILVRPTFLGNIGSVARVLKNFGFQNLRLVSPPRNYKDAEARKMSLGAFDLLKSAECFETLSDALKDINIAVGTTCATQRVCQAQLITDLSTSLRQSGTNRIAIVLGEERDGLKTEELGRCNFIATIPCNPDFPSLNLAQAAGIFAYELTRSLSAGDMNSASGLEHASGADSEAFMEHLERFLHEIEFTKSFNEKRVTSELRQLLAKATPSARELILLNALLKKLDGFQRESRKQ